MDVYDVDDVDDVEEVEEEEGLDGGELLLVAVVESWRHIRLPGMTSITRHFTVIFLSL